MDTVTPKRLSLCALDRTGSCQTLNRPMRRSPLGKGVNGVNTSHAPLPPLCVTKNMCDNMCMHPGVCDGVYEHVSTAQLGVGGRTGGGVS